MAFTDKYSSRGTAYKEKIGRSGQSGSFFGIAVFGLGKFGKSGSPKKTSYTAKYSDRSTAYINKYA